MTQKILYHYTCSHVRERLGKKGTLRPHPQPWLGGVRLIWLTDMATPDRAALGLTSVLLSCDRTQVRYQVTGSSGAVVPWGEWARQHQVPVDQQMTLEAGRQPARWWVAEGPVRVRLAPLAALGTREVSGRHTQGS